MRSRETFVSKARPDRNYSDVRTLHVVKDEGRVAGMDAFGYISFARPFPLGARILSATLTFHTWAIPEGGSHTMEVRPTADSFAFKRVTWATRPSVVPSGGATVTKKGALPTHEEWSFDVRADMQKVSDGRPWYGWRITTNDSIRRKIVAAEAEFASKGFEPHLSIEWSDQPDEPANLHPDEGVVGINAPAMTFDYLPIDEDATLQKVRVQTSSSESFAVPTWDSGERDWTDTTIYPAQLGYPGAAEGEPVYWRLRVMDQGGWSRWSPAAEFTYIPEPPIVMTGPAGDGPPTQQGDSIIFHSAITDVTPQVSWSCPGQESYRVTVSLQSSSFAIQDRIWDSGRVYDTIDHIEIPKGVFTREDVEYRIMVRIYDKHPRIAVANDDWTFAGAQVIVHFTEDPAQTLVQNLVAKQLPRSPKVRVTWSRVATADEYQIIRDGVNDLGSSRRVILDQIPHADLVQEDGTFRYIDRTAPPRTPLNYVIRPVENGKRGKATRGSTIETRLDGIWLVKPGFSLMIAGDDQGTWELPEVATVHQVVGAMAPTVIREPHQGYQGNLNGILVEEDKYQPDLTAQMKRDRFLQIKEDPRNLRLVVADMNIPVRVANLNVYPTPFHDLRYECSFDFWQDGEVWWEYL